MRGRLTIRIVILAIAAALIVWILPRDDDTSENEPALPPTLADAPDLDMTDATVVQYDVDGNRKYRLSAGQIQRFESAGVTTLSHPDLLIDNPEDPPWDIRANAGTVRELPGPDGVSEERVDLEGNVQLLQQHANGRFLRLDTEAISYFPDRRYAETDRNVMIDTDVGRTMAAGLQGELDKGLFFLDSNATQRVHTIVLEHQFR